ncbi:MAG: dihydroorotase [Chloroflexi bacterium]|nr:dihydroorotase [Chloroflexota bacterium]
MADSTLIKGGRVVDPSQGLDAIGDVLITDGLVVSAGTIVNDAPKDCTVIDATGLVVTPGFIDLHVHLREPGQEDKETVATGALAAVRGGFTTICAMPNTEPPMDNAAVIRQVLDAASQAGFARVLPIGCATRGRKGKELADMAELAAAGAVGFSDDGSPIADAGLMRNALSYSTTTGLPVINHCEEPSLSKDGVLHEGWVASRLGLPGQPAAAEESMVARDIELAALTGGRLHVAHISTAGTLELVRRAKERGLPVTAEVTPHHLILTEEWALGTIEEGAGELTAPDKYAPLTRSAYDTRAKVNPPLRTEDDTEALVAGLKDGTIDAIATDHAPHTSIDKECTMQEAAFGISGLETAFGLVNGLVDRGDIDLPTLIERLTTGPARVLGESYQSSIGTLKPGASGDVTVLDPEAEWVVDSSTFASKGRNTPIDGITLKGQVVKTIVGGRLVHDLQETAAKGSA